MLGRLVARRASGDRSVHYVIGGRSPAPEGGVLEVDGAIPGIERYEPTGG